MRIAAQCLRSVSVLLGNVAAVRLLFGRGVMGKRFSVELDSLASTYSWAQAVDIDALRDGLCRLMSLPLFVIGSGGSLSAAAYVASLHERFAGRHARTMTPLDCLGQRPPVLTESGVCLLSASGRNPDILGALDYVVACEPRELFVLALRSGSPLAARASTHEHHDVVEHDLPCGKDGFLATNSLLATCTLIARGYAAKLSVPDQLPGDFADLVLPGTTMTSYRQDLEELLRPVLDRQNLVVLHGNETRAAAIDLESKFTEAAVGATQLADYRNFAHGRHHWLDKRGRESGVVALSTETDSVLAERTLSMLPSDIPIAHLRIPHAGHVAGLSALASVLFVTEVLGRARGIDPGRPTVASFGRGLYRMRLPKEVRPARSLWAAAIERKARACTEDISARGDLASWTAAYDDFLGRLGGAKFRAVVFDYDGTLCGRQTRFKKHPSPGVAEHLQRLLANGLLVGIATGRGDSARGALAAAVGRKLQQNVLVGYYNGGDLRRLSEVMTPPGSPDPGTPLGVLAAALRAEPVLASHASIKANPLQISIRTATPGSELLVWGATQHCVATVAPGLQVVRSSHSVDVLAPAVSKRALVDWVRSEVEEGSPILTIGDRGGWPGNDYELLAFPFSLSVDEVSPDPTSCWNLAPPGMRCVSGVLDYLSALEVQKGYARFSNRWLSKRARS